MPSEIGMCGSIARGGAIIAAIRQIFEDRRHRIVTRILGKPDFRGQLHAIRHFDKDRIEQFRLARKLRNRFHDIPLNLLAS